MPRLLSADGSNSSSRSSRTMKKMMSRWQWNTLHAPLAHRQTPKQLLQIHRASRVKTIKEGKAIKDSVTTLLYYPEISLWQLLRSFAAGRVDTRSTASATATDCKKFSAAMIIIDGARQRGDDDRWSHFKSQSRRATKWARKDGSKFLKLHCGKT